jgi:hypothetical protein
MIRQDELPWQGQVTVLLDLRESVHSAASLELALSAVVSVAYGSSQLNRKVRLLASDGTDTGLGSGHAHLSGILEYLAAAKLDPTPTLAGPLALVTRGSVGGGMVTVTTDRASGSDVVAALRLRSWYGSTVVVRLERSSWDPGDGRLAGSGSGSPKSDPRIVRVTAEAPFPVAWNRAMSSSRRPVGMLQ